MDFGCRRNFINRMRQFPSGRFSRSGLVQLAKYLLLPGLSLFALAGCNTLPGIRWPGRPDAVATVRVYVPTVVEAGAGNEVGCEIQSIDGITLDGGDRLSPGKHRLIVSFNSGGKAYVGDVDLVIPEAKNYRLKAERKDDSITLSLVEAKTAKVVATSTAPAEQQMKFLVFVIQS